MDQDSTAQNQRVSDNIREHGWHCLHVFPTREGQDTFSYSIGFAESYEAPEVLPFWHQIASGSHLTTRPGQGRFAASVLHNSG